MNKFNTYMVLFKIHMVFVMIKWIIENILYFKSL